MYEFSLLAIPAKALYQAIKAVITPKTPPALVTPTFPENSPIVNNKNVISKKKNNEKNATVDFKVQSKMPNVKITHLNKKKATAFANSCLSS